MAEVPDSKLWWQSKTLWINLIGLVVAVVTSLAAIFQWVNADTMLKALGGEAGLLAIVNVILRMVTGVPLDWGSSPKVDVGP